MYIKKIKLHGFKSFLNKTEINLERGLTSIVGPNGCGKTNIVDAVRWVLGEQKNSRLRSSKKEDVIFNGTSTKKAISFCEVKLIINNDRKILPIEYREIEVSRRLFRIGESEYYINKNKCRLKDIQNLFMDTGMSSDAYSVIELKMIDNILIDNHSNLKTMLESASGILNYNQQRKKTNSKLEKVSDDLLRINDIIFEVEKKIKSLNLQMKRYEKHQTLLDKLKEKEILFSSFNIKEIEKSKVKFSNQLKNMDADQLLFKKELISDQRKVLKFQKNQNLYREKINAITNQVINKNKKLHSLSNSIIKYSENQKYHNSQIDYYLDQISELTSSIKHSEKKIKKIKNDLKQINLLIKENSNNYSIFNTKYSKDIKKREQILNQKNKESQKIENLFKQKLNYESQINLLESKVSNYENHLIDLKKFKYDKNCKYCVKNGHNQINEKKEITQRLKKNKILLKKIKNKQIENIKNYDIQNKLLKKLKDKLTAHNKKNEKINESFHELKIDKIKLTKEKEGFEYRLNYFSNSKEDFFKKIEVLKNDIKFLKRKNTEINNKIKADNKNRNKINNELKKINTENQSIEKKYKLVSLELKELQRIVSNKQTLKEDQIIGKQKYEIELSRLENEIKIISNYIKEKYNINILKNLIFKENLNINNLEEDIKKSKASISNIGPINMEVSIDYNNESQRFDFLNKQRNDLEDSKKTLKKTILKLDKEAKKKYLDTFNDINKHLKTTFSMFFKGGDSYLNILDSDNPLESNIEIIAKPPGKKIKKLNMLSAGEKALTAISILFAIYLKKPSPFCILDEVDAPLDDNNIDKFTSVLKEFSKKTQFIIITHNKLTMNQSNLLYGVTQQEEGISKVVSVKLNK